MIRSNGHADLITMYASYISTHFDHANNILLASLFYLFFSTAAMSTLHPEANPALAGSDVYKSMRMRNKQIHRALGAVPTIAAFSYRHRIGRYFEEDGVVL